MTKRTTKTTVNALNNLSMDMFRKNCPCVKRMSEMDGSHKIVLERNMHFMSTVL